jgi:hypothetical protein
MTAKEKKEGVMSKNPKKEKTLKRQENRNK